MSEKEALENVELTARLVQLDPTRANRARLMEAFRRAGKAFGKISREAR